VEEARVRPAPGPPSRRVVVIDEDAPLSRTPIERQPEAEDPAIGATLHDDGQKRRWRLFRKGGE